MKFAFCLTTYFPFGGLQRDFVRMASVALARGHRVDAFTTRWQGDAPKGLNVTCLPVNGWTNHARTRSLAAALAQRVKQTHYDAVVGFNKMPGLDLYFAADPCYAHRAAQKSAWYRLTSRCRWYLRLEAAVFAADSHTRILSISEPQQALYMQHYGTPPERFHALPPGISPDRIVGGDREEVRRRLRSQLAVGGEEFLLLMVGSDYRRKGVDRAIRALSNLPPQLRARTVLAVAGRGRPAPYERLAGRGGVSERVRFLGQREDIPGLLAAADLLLHPAYEENTGTVLIEALAAGLPLLVTEVCGYSRYVRESGAGLVVPAPFHQADLDRCLADMLGPGADLERLRRNARRYVAETDLFSLSETAVDIIEQVAQCLSCPSPG